MKRIAIVICSHYGQTKKIGDFMAAQIVQMGLTADVFNVVGGKGPSSLTLNRYDAVLLGGPLYFGEYSELLLDWAGANCERLNSVLTGFFSVGTSQTGNGTSSKMEVVKSVKRFAGQTGIRPSFVAGFGGALPYTKLGFFKRIALKKMCSTQGAPTDMSKDHELTNWVNVTSFVQAFASQDRGSTYAVSYAATHGIALSPGLRGISQAA